MPQAKHKTKFIYSKKMPSVDHFPSESILLFDSVLLKKSFFKKWLSHFPYKVALKSGEKLKTLNEFQKIAEKISRLKTPQTSQLTFICVGGGSVGDFCGFLASVYLRGRPFIQIPSTWLAAVDSAHGGKTGLNLLMAKNQLGTFYSPEITFLVEELLLSQPKERFIESFGEVLKTSLYGSTNLFKNLESLKWNEKKLFKALPELIQLKLNIVKQDPFEKIGHRRILNLGHTVGHIYESAFHWPHGISVLAGILFATRYSLAKGYLNDSDFIRIWNLIHKWDTGHNYQTALQKLSVSQFKKLVSKDKKITSQSEIDYIFIKKIGSVFRKKITLDDLVAEFKRQKMEI